MFFQTKDDRWFYFGINTKAKPGDEFFGISFGRLYFGYYGRSGKPSGFAFGWLDENGVLN